MSVGDNLRLIMQISQNKEVRAQCNEINWYFKGNPHARVIKKFIIIIIHYWKYSGNKFYFLFT